MKEKRLLQFWMKCHFVIEFLSERSGKRGIRLISKSILEEFVNYYVANPGELSRNARIALSGKTINDKYEYGYDSTFSILAKIVIRRK